MKKILLTLAILTLTFMHAEPTKIETYNFFKSKVEGKEFKNLENYGTQENLTLNHKNDMCTLIYTSYSTDKERNGFSSWDQKEVFTVNLREIDPDTIKYRKLYYHHVEFHIKEEKNLVDVKYFYSPKYLKKHNYMNYDKDQFNTSFRHFTSSSERNARKAAKALRHLVRLCGGKAELF